MVVGQPFANAMTPRSIHRAPSGKSVHTMLVIGPRDLEAGAVSVRLHHGGPQGAKPKAEVVANILAAIEERRD